MAVRAEVEFPIEDDVPAAQEAAEAAQSEAEGVVEGAVDAAEGAVDILSLKRYNTRSKEK